MPEEQRTSGESSAASARGAAKTGKAIANIAKGAATGGAHGAALAAAKESKKWIAGIAILLLLPVLIVLMLPVVIFGSLFGIGTDEPNAIVDNTVLSANMVSLNTGISTILSEGLTDVLARIDADFAASGCDEKEVNNPYGADVPFNANQFISMYCASKDTDVESISQSDLEAVLRQHVDQLYSFTYKDETRTVEADSSSDSSSEEVEETTITVRVYTVTYNGEWYFADHVFALSEDQKDLADNYAENLSVFLSDGSYQVLSDTEFSAMGLSYDGVVFTDGETQVVYYNQLDERWKDEPYGTDNIGGYACGPTAMSIVVSSLTSDTVDPPHMAQWAYENGYWCSKSGSYHSLIPGAAKAWGLACEGCTPSEPQRIVDALADGKLVVALMAKGHFTSSGHFIVLRGVTSEGKILVADPASYQRSNKEWDLSIILDEAGYAHVEGYIGGSKMSSTYRIVRLLRNHLYPTYQLHAYMASKKTSPQDGLRLAALITMHWIRLRLGEHVPETFTHIPEPDHYLDCDDSCLFSTHINEGYVIDIVSLPEHGMWSMQVTEPDLGSDPGNVEQVRSPVPGRVIET